MGRTTDKVCIIGAGAAGLSTAHYLVNDKGYKNVTILEKAERVGGKVWTIASQVWQPLEMGAVEVTRVYKNVRALAKEVGAELLFEPPRGVYNLKTDKLVMSVLPLFKGKSIFSLGIAGIQYIYYVAWKYRSYLNGPKMAGAPDELKITMEKFMSHGLNRMAPLAPIFGFSVTDYGYLKMDQVSAAYVMRYINWSNFRMILALALKLNKWPRIFKTGFQDLFEKVAEPLNVELNTEIDYIMIGSPIKVYRKGQETPEAYDKLIVTCCLDDTLKSLIKNLPPEADKLFSLTQYSEYWTTACVVKDTPRSVLGAFPLPPTGSTMGILKSWGDKDGKGKAAVFYAEGDEAKGIGKEHIYEMIKQDSAKLGFEVVEMLEQKKWNYFPHVNPDQFNNHYEDLEALQGQNNTYFAGGLLSFETVHNVVSYSKNLVNTYF